MRRPRRLALVGGLLLALVVTAALATPALAKTRKPTTTAPETTTTTTWPPLPAIDTAVSWADCGNGFECTTLAVPVEWRTPQGETLPLALIRHPALEPTTRIGALVVNFGGPGVGGVDYLRQTYDRLPEVIRSRFDVVSFDPRGTGASRPIDCVDDSYLDLGNGLPAVADSAAALDVVHRYNAGFAAACKTRMGAYAGQVGTRNGARDLEAIRLALREPKLTYVGYSYGTVLGAAYAQMFPGNVRSMVLDGPLDLSLSTYDYDFAQAQGFMHALDSFLSWCEQTRCSLSESGPPAAVFNQLIARVAQQPLPASYTVDGTTRQGVLTPSLLEAGVLAMLYDEARGWPALADALGPAVQDGQGGRLLAIADQYLGRQTDGTWTPFLEANAVISCVDRPATTRLTDAQELAQVQSFQSQLPPWGGSWGTIPCVGMPKPARGDKLGDVRVTSTGPIVVIGTTGDPATPYTGAQAMAGRIAGSDLLTYDSTEHTAYGSGRSTCIDDTVDAYLVDGTPPAPGTHCAPG